MNSFSRRRYSNEIMHMKKKLFLLPKVKKATKNSKSLKSSMKTVKRSELREEEKPHLKANLRDLNLTSDINTTI